MSAAEHPFFYYPNKMARIILLAMEEILGSNGIHAVLNLAELPALINNYPANNFDMRFKFDDLGKIQYALDDLYGPRGGHGLALRSGRACFKYGLREFGPLMGLSDVAFRLLPVGEKLHTGAGIFAETFNRFTDQRVRVEEGDGQILWHIDRCPVCWGRKTSEPVCHLAVGILQEALTWVSGGRQFIVEETHCIARGDSACTIRIDTQPLD